MPLISVIIPVYNTERYLKECLDSVLAQTFQDIEVICVDDGSTDDSLAVLRDYEKRDTRVRVIAKENGGVVSARKAGIEQASGEYLTFVDSDDYVAQNMAERMVENIGEADLISFDIYRQYANEKLTEFCSFYEGKIYQGKDYEQMVATMIYDPDSCRIHRLIAGPVAKLFRRSLVEKLVHGLECDIRYAEDALFLYEYILQCKSVKIVHESLYYYRYREDSAVHSMNKEMLMDINKLYLALECVFSGHSLENVLTAQLQRWVAQLTCNALNEYMGFDNEIVYLPEFQADCGDLRHKKIVIYGAGKCGQDIHRQLSFFGYDIAGWADRDYLAYQSQGYDVQSPEKLRELEADVILIAVGNEELAETIKRSLIEKGISQEKLVWKKLRHIY